jgi:hypothetical protein
LSAPVASPVEGLLTLPANQKIRRLGRRGVRLGRQARIIAAHHDAGGRSERAEQPDQPERGSALEGHDRQAHDVGLALPHEPLHRLANARLDQDEIGDGDLVMRVDVTGEGRERPVGHTDGDRRHVLEGVRHGEQQDAHVPSAYQRPGRTASPSERRRRPTTGTLGCTRWFHPAPLADACC